MWLGMGPRSVATDLVPIFQQCHERIRKFIDLACKLGEVRDAEPEQVRDAARAVSGYFAHALPLHARDEEDSVAPRLRGKSDELDRALARMSEEHSLHTEPLLELLSVCGHLAEKPELHSKLARTLTTIAVALRSILGDHLDSEERIIFPAIEQHLSETEQAEILVEIRARRAPPS